MTPACLDFNRELLSWCPFVSLLPEENKVD